MPIDFTPLTSASLTIQAHAATVIPAFFLGALQLILPKGTRLHRGAGYLFMALMLATAAIAFFIPSYTGTRFSLIHLFVPLTILGTLRAWANIRKGNVIGHAWAIAAVYFGAVIIAGYFAFMPGRIMHEIFIGA